jgi:thymidylate synthase ThyX
MATTAKIICDSISPDGVRLTTMEVTFHRFILAELNTHRVFSRNSASSRAIPSEKIRQRVNDDMAYPLSWGRNERGMQSSKALDLAEETVAKQLWYETGDESLRINSLLDDLGLHKQVANRILEPYMWHTAIITATEWDNFFHQRCHPDAQPEMKALADAMQLAYYTNEAIVKLSYGSWHLPYINTEDFQDVGARYADDEMDAHDTRSFITAILRKVSVARCARVSYLTQNGKRDIEKDIELFERLTQGGHWSPFEHIAMPLKLGHLHEGKSIAEWSGNFRGWKQYRKEFPQENRTKFIPNLPELMKGDS